MHVCLNWYKRPINLLISQTQTNQQWMTKRCQPTVKNSQMSLYFVSTCKASPNLSSNTCTIGNKLKCNIQLDALKLDPYSNLECFFNGEQGCLQYNSKPPLGNKNIMHSFQTTKRTQCHLHEMLFKFNFFQLKERLYPSNNI